MKRVEDKLASQLKTQQLTEAQEAMKAQIDCARELAKVYRAEACAEIKANRARLDHAIASNRHELHTMN